MIELGIVSFQDFAHFLRISVQNPALYFYWTVVDIVLNKFSTVENYELILAVGVVK